MSTANSRQHETVAFLSDQATWDGSPVERLDTHGAIVFLVGEHAFKMKRAVRFPYLDYSTLERREQACRQEVVLNRRTAPALYLGVKPVVSDAQGRLRLGEDEIGDDETVEWLVVMRRFPQEALLDGMAQRGEVTAEHARALADAVARFHAAAEPTAASAPWGGAGAVRQTLTETLDALDEAAEWYAVEASDEGGAAWAHSAMAELRDAAMTAWWKAAPLLDARRADGKVRHCHGDLHLRNVCMVDGVPTLFDCIEFNEAFAWIDVLHDLAFLIMDMEHRDLRPLANLLFNRYVLNMDEFDGLACLPLFLAERAMVRAKVAPSAAAAVPERTKAQRAEAVAYLWRALGYLEPPTPRLVAVGGLSGSGKSTLASHLAPKVGAAPGALHLRTDVLRKRRFGVAETERLPEEAYTPEQSRRVFREMFSKAARALTGGHSVVLDGVFGDRWQRDEAAETARRAGVPFTPIWLEAPREVLLNRVENRRDDASDATAEIVHRQIEAAFQPEDWIRLSSDGSPESVASRALERLQMR